MKTLYFDCFAGASGNMILGGLVSLGVAPEQIILELQNLNVSEFDIEFSKVNRAGISAIHAKTIYKEEKVHRHFSDIKKIIEESGLDSSIKERSIEIFRNLTKAEAKVHGVEIEKVHFHEVGAMDAILDVVGTCIGFELLGIEKFVCSKIHVGSGFIDIAHGKYPVPPPAVAELLKGIPTYSTEIVGELITPTGAAIISTVCNSFGELADFESEIIGYGAGTREYENFPNVLRLMIGADSIRRHEDTQQKGVGEVQKAVSAENLLLLETNLDDVTGEVLGFVMERAFEKGALDCWFTPIQMKKNRPATMVSILCRIDDKAILSELLYKETTTLGIRITEVKRECLAREIRTVKTAFGEVNIKVASLNGKIVNAKPEYEQMRKIALESNKPIIEIEQSVLKEFRKVEEGS